MKKFFGSIILVLLLSLSGCSPVGAKMASTTLLYGVAAVLSLLLLIAYGFLVRKKEPWLLLLFSSVLLVNIGYLALSVSRTLEEALLANRISYLGSVFLPLFMLMIIFGACGLKRKKWLTALLVGLGIAVFLVAASPGYLNIYYKEVSLEVIDGVSVLDKEYGPWHCLYLFYLLAYFAVMIATIVYVTLRRRVPSNKHAVILAVAVFVNIGVWLLEQLIKVDFEFLSISYIISELFLLSLYLMLQEYGEPGAQTRKENPAFPEATAPVTASEEAENEAPEALPFQKFPQLSLLTPTERTIFDLYLEGRSTKEVMKALNITENTLKYHNKNIYGKLGVSSRKQLLGIAAAPTTIKVSHAPPSASGDDS